MESSSVPAHPALSPTPAEAALFPAALVGAVSIPIPPATSISATGITTTTAITTVDVADPSVTATPSDASTPAEAALVPAALVKVASINASGITTTTAITSDAITMADPSTTTTICGASAVVGPTMTDPTPILADHTIDSSAMGATSVDASASLSAGSTISIAIDSALVAMEAAAMHLVAAQKELPHHSLAIEKVKLQIAHAQAALKDIVAHSSADTHAKVLDHAIMPWRLGADLGD